MTLNRACTPHDGKGGERGRADHYRHRFHTISRTVTGDIMEPEGAKFRSDTPFLWQHDRSQPIGTCTPKMVKGRGLEITARLVKPTPGYAVPACCPPR
ncbi:Uncharacterised protein [Cronobacter sakazakii]|nr:Uncharacterised protein [Cronobacter sakazakii]